MSERAAAEILAQAQGLGREQARQLLLTGAAGQGVRIGRVRRGRPFRCEWPWTKQAEALATQPAMPPKTRALVVGVPIVAWGGLPWVATVSGFVVFVSTATGARLDEDGRTVFELAPPDQWSTAVAGRWFHTGPGWHWFSWHPDRLTQ